MKSTACFPIILLFALSTMVGQVASLENDLLRLEWDAGRGTLVSLKDKASGREWIDPKSVVPIYAVQFTNESSLIPA